MEYYIGIDLHSSSNHLAIIDQSMKRVLKRKLPNDLTVILHTLYPYEGEVAGIAVESTYNWYWLVDGLMESDYRVHLANPSAMRRYTGLKYADDTHDAFWLAELLKLGILPEGYIYPKEMRPVRDLLRKRGHLVRLRTSLILSLQNTITRNYGVKVSSNEIKKLTGERAWPHLVDHEDIAMSVRVSKEAIDFLARQIAEIETVVEKKVKLKKPYQNLLTIPGIGKILALTIMLETGPISRFPKVGHYVSYCRKVASKWTGNGKIKGRGNRKNGNKHLAWAFSEAAEFARRFNPASRDFYNRKRSKKNLMVAHNALAHKLARAAYYIMRDNVPFEEAKLYA